MPVEEVSVGRGGIFVVIRVYEYLLKISGALLPLLGIWYLQAYQSPQMCSVEHAMHNVAVLAATVLSGFVAYVTWRCYRYSGEPFLRWLTLGFLGFTIIYAPHGLFTSISDTHMALFLLYGPTSRVVMGVLLFIGLLSYGRRRDVQSERDRHGRWWLWGAFFIAIDVAVAVVAETSLLKLLNWRIWLEMSALVVSISGVLIVLARHRSLPLMMTYALSLALFAQSSISFLLATPWNHQWWYAHAVFAVGFFFLSYGVVRAFLTTGAFSTVFSAEELMSRLRIEKNNTEEALRQLQVANSELALMASTDSLTGASSRRHFLATVGLELSRAARNGLPLSLLALDIDNFKSVNDKYGHQAGDAVLRYLAESVREALRPHDVFGRVGGEEFMILLPDTSKGAASVLAERIRSRVESMAIPFVDGVLRVTVSIGVAEFGIDGEMQDEVFKVADDRLYRAKHAGRNLVVS